MGDWLEWTFETHGYSIDVNRVTSTYADLDDEDVECGVTDDDYGAYDAFSDWIGSHSVPREKDFNLCLLYDYGNDGVVGCGGGDLAVVENGKAIEQLVTNNVSPRRFTDDTEPYAAIHRGLHEVGHCLNFSHDDGHGNVDDQKNRWYYSPLSGPNESPPNNCGYTYPSKPSGYDTGREMTYCACALSHISIV